MLIIRSHDGANAYDSTSDATFSTVITFGRSSLHDSTTDANSARFSSIAVPRCSEFAEPTLFRPAYGLHSGEKWQ